MRNVEAISSGLRSLDGGRRRDALREVGALGPEELAEVDHAALLAAIGGEDVAAVKRDLAFVLEGLELPLDPDEYGYGAEPDPGLAAETTVESLDALRRFEEAEAEDG